MAYPISDVTRRIVYSGSAGVGPYSFSFEVLEETDVAVYKNTDLLTLTTDYTVTINVDGTGSVTLVSAATGSDQITLVGDRAVARSTDFVTGGDLFANSLNDEFDSLVIFAQQIKETADRGLKAAITDPTDVNMTLPAKADRKGKVLAFDSTTGDPVSGPALDSMITVISQSANINTVADNIADVNTVAADLNGADTVGTVAGIAANVTTVATDIANINTVAGNLDGADTIGTVAGINADITTVAGIAADVTAVANNEVDVSQVAADIAKVIEVANDLQEAVSEIDTVANSITNVNTVGTNIANVNTVAGVSANVTTVAGISGNVTTVAGVSANVTTVAGVSSDVTAVAGIASNVTAVANDATDIGLVATSIANVNNVGNDISNVNAVANDLANIDAVAADLPNLAVKVNKTADTGSAVIPTGTQAQRDGTPSAGYFRFNSDSSSFEGYNGSAWGSVGGGATGGGNDAVFIENDQTVTTNYTIAATKNAMSTGPLTINSGVTVTVETGARWIVI